MAKFTEKYVELYLFASDEHRFGLYTKWISSEHKIAQYEMAKIVLSDNQYDIMLDQSQFPGSLQATIPHKHWIKFVMDDLEEDIVLERCPEMIVHRAQEPLEGMKRAKYPGKKLNIALLMSEHIEDFLATVDGKWGREGHHDVLFDYVAKDSEKYDELVRVAGKMLFVPYKYWTNDAGDWYMCLKTGEIRSFLGYNRKLEVVAENEVWRLPDAHLLAMDIEDISGYPAQNCRLLDLGCGDGRLASAAPWEKYVGVDSNKKLPRDSSFISSRIERTEIRENFDVAVCADVLQHTEQPYFLFSWIVKHTPARKIIFKVPSYEETGLLFHYAIDYPIGWKFTRNKWARFLVGKHDYKGYIVDCKLSSNGAENIYLVLEN